MWSGVRVSCPHSMWITISRFQGFRLIVGQVRGRFT